ncbi:thiopeptide-type bacteriocin biosynthesis protein [Streptomyces scabiei]|uniref:thiopeptide-type bacteriocin biosynthesis protein n=1 Tax=Streptomyces scabiei TaxID=1930 RepID=UPI0007658548|nr:thiopeptide-type bacteriocin biosynthesis protein [Streptomyces scabiei]
MTLPAWRQANLVFPEWENAETIAVSRLAPILRVGEDEGALARWFIIRKHPCWRMRYLPAAGGAEHIAQGLDTLVAEGAITAWTEIVYEPEEHAFGGTEAMASAHRLFHHDSRSLLEHLQSKGGLHRRETSLMLCSILMRSAGLDWYEQGDVWARVGAHRETPPGATPESREQLQAAVHRLISVNEEELMRTGGPLAHLAEWARAYRDAGRDLAHLMELGLLHRGLRDVLAHHALFAWNRIGLPYATQAALAAAAKTAVFGPDPTTERSVADRVDTP